MFKDPLPVDGLDLDLELTRLERRLVDEALIITRGNQTAAARLLRIKRSTLVTKLRRRSGRKVAA